jgi:hypothetical protein
MNADNNRVRKPDRNKPSAVFGDLCRVLGITAIVVLIIIGALKVIRIW